MDNLRRIFRRLTRRYLPVSPNNVGYRPMYYSLNYGFDTEVNTGAMTRALKNKEKPDTEAFFNTGVPGRQVNLFLSSKGSVQLCGYDVQDSPVLCTITKSSITANIKRANHIKDLLNEVAAREVLRIRWVDGPIAPLGGVPVAFWKFNNIKEVDDSELISVAKPMMAPTEPEYGPEEPIQMQYVSLEAIQRYQSVWTSGTSARVDW